MAKLPSNLVFFAFALMSVIYNSKCRATHYLSILSVRNRNIVVLGNGTILSTTTPPSLNSLIRVTFTFYSTTQHNQPMVRLEAAATNYKICMNKTGKLYVKQKRRRWKKHHTIGNKQTQSRHSRHQQRKERHHRQHRRQMLDDCAFRLYDFDLNESYHRTAIYSVPHSTEKMGQFVAFGKDGRPRSLKKSFTNLAFHARIGMIIVLDQNPNVDLIIQNTTFRGSGKINWAIRHCIQNHRRKHEIFIKKRFRSHRRINNVFDVIRKCRRQHQPTFKRGTRKNPRKNLSQNSMQRKVSPVVQTQMS